MTVCKFRKRKTKFLCCAHLLHKVGTHVFHVAIVQSNFADLNLLFLFAVTVAKTPYCCHPEILLPW